MGIWLRWTSRVDWTGCTAWTCSTGHRNPISTGWVRLAGDLLDAPIALLSVIDRHRQFFLAADGLSDALATARQTTLDYSICRYPMASGRPLIVGDTRADPQLAAHLAVRDMGVLAYAGIPLTEPHGCAFGALCVIDVAVRDWDDHQLAILARLAQIATEICAPEHSSSGSEEAAQAASSVG
jgi:GAF domain-containing protein